MARGAGAVLAITLHPEADKQITGSDCLQLSHIKVGGPDMADVQNYATSLTAYIPAPVVTSLTEVAAQGTPRWGTVYRLDGTRVGALSQVWPHLPAGLYIVNGKRIMKR